MTFRYSYRHHFSDGSIRCLSLSDDRHLIARVGAIPGVTVFEEEGDVLKKRKTLKSEQHRCAFSPDGRFLAIGAKSIKVLETEKFKTIATIKVSKKAPIKALAWSPDSKRLVAAAETSRLKSTVVIWERETGAERRIESDDFGNGYHSPSVCSSLAFLPDHQTLVSAALGHNRHVMTLNLPSGEQKHPPATLLHQARPAQPPPAGAATTGTLTHA